MRNAGGNPIGQQIYQTFSHLINAFTPHRTERSCLSRSNFTPVPGRGVHRMPAIHLRTPCRDRPPGRSATKSALDGPILLCQYGSKERFWGIEPQNRFGPSRRPVPTPHPVGEGLDPSLPFLSAPLNFPNTHHPEWSRMGAKAPGVEYLHNNRSKVLQIIEEVR